MDVNKMEMYLYSTETSLDKLTLIHYWLDHGFLNKIFSKMNTKDHKYFKLTIKNLKKIEDILKTNSALEEVSIWKDEDAVFLEHVKNNLKKKCHVYFSNENFLYN
ncbi:MAG: hypothetical protein KGO49_06985 [Gammaproteobacteria bacterium]|nr:hypothetical protein [Gammaproteobacteria bacterium]